MRGSRPAPVQHPAAPAREPGRLPRVARPTTGPPAPTWSYAAIPLTAPGEAAPLPPPLRRRLETRIGAPLGDVALHRGPEADRAAAAVGARAFTHGRHITLGAGLDPAAPTTYPLLAHEAAHAAQQANARAGAISLRTRSGDPAEREADTAALGRARPTAHPLAIAAAPPDFAAPGFKTLWTAYEQARGAADTAKALDIARQLAEIGNADFADLLHHGIELAGFLQVNAEPALAARVLERVRDAYQISFVTTGHNLPALNFAMAGSDPDTLIRLGEAAARAGRDDEALLDLGAAHEILSYYALDLTAARTTAMQGDADADAAIAGAAGSDKARLQALHDAAELPRLFSRGKQYSDLGAVYDAMRRIYGVYAGLEREALAAKDSAKAADARAKSDALHRVLRETYSWGSAQPPGSIGQTLNEPVETGEVSYVDTERGPGLRLHGANSAETDLTQLPGLPSPKEVGNNIQVQNLGNLQQALVQQSDFQAELAREPAIRAAFPAWPIDLNDPVQRQKAWRVMYGVFAKTGGNALGSLMALIGRYQKAYTIHTTYNVRDWGVSYLDTTMPTDLAGRVEKDCGVYALTVAWDVFQTAKYASPALDLNFELFSMLEHVALIVTDTAAGSFYVVNNDEISGPFTGDKLAKVAQLYQGVRGLDYTVGPAVPVTIGGTKQSDRAFHDRAWDRYKNSADWGLSKPELPPETRALATTDPAAYDRAFAAAWQDRYKSFYARQEALDRGLRELDPQIDALASVAGDPAALARAIAPVAAKAGALADMFTALGPKEGIGIGSTATMKLIEAGVDASQAYIFTRAAGHTVHPLARVGQAVLHLQALGATPSPAALAILQFCDTIPDFHRALATYRAAGATGPF